MKIWIFLLSFCLLSGNMAIAQIVESTIEKEIAEKAVCYYVYISNRTDKGNEKGDVIDAIPCSEITPPEWDFKNFDIIKMSLTEKEATDMILPLLKEDSKDSSVLIVEKARAVQIDVKDLTEKKEYTKDEIAKDITIKSVSDIAVER